MRQKNKSLEEAFYNEKPARNNSRAPILRIFLTNLLISLKEYLQNSSVANNPPPIFASHEEAAIKEIKNAKG